MLRIFTKLLQAEPDAGGGSAGRPYLQSAACLRAECNENAATARQTGQDRED